MDLFEQYYRDELSYLRLLAQDIANDRPLLQPFLNQNGDADVERLFEGFAFLTAGVRQKIEDYFPELTQNVLSHVWPMPLHPIPATSVVQFSAKQGQLTEVIDLQAGCELFALVQDQEVTFTICHHLHTEPLTLVERRLEHSNDKSELSLTFRYEGQATHWRTGPISLYLSPDSQIAGLLRLWLDQYLDNVLLCYADQPLSVQPLLETNWLSADQLILPIDDEAFWPLQRLSEFFYLPHVHDFVTLDLRPVLSAIPLNEERTFKLTLVFNRLLPLAVGDHQQIFMPNCVPVINLYSQQTEEIPFMPNKSDYLLDDLAIFDLCSVLTGRDGQDEDRGNKKRFQPMSTVGVLANRTEPAQQNTYFYESRIVNDVLDHGQIQLIFHDHYGRPISAVDGSFICHYRRFDPRAAQLSLGDITIAGEGIPSELVPTNIVPMSQAYPALANSQYHWQLFSLLSLSPFFLNDLAALKSQIILFDFYPELDKPLSRKIGRYVAGITAIKTRPTDLLDKGIPYRGLNITLTLDERCYTDSGEMYAFALVLNSFFSVFQTKNSFHVMQVIMQQTQECWHLKKVPGQRNLM